MLLKGTCPGARRVEARDLLIPTGTARSAFPAVGLLEPAEPCPQSGTANLNGGTSRARRRFFAGGCVGPPSPLPRKVMTSGRLARFELPLCYAEILRARDPHLSQCCSA